MKKLLFISLCIANLLCSSENNSWQLNKWYQQSLSHINNGEKLPKNNLTFYDAIQDINKTNKLVELKSAAENKLKYYQDLSFMEYRKIVGIETLKNTGRTIASVACGKLALDYFPTAFENFLHLYFRYSEFFGCDSRQEGGGVWGYNGKYDSFTAFIMVILITTASAKYAWKYSNCTAKNIKDCIYIEDALLNKQKIASNNFQKINTFHNKIISNKDL